MYIVQTQSLSTKHLHKHLQIHFCKHLHKDASVVASLFPMGDLSPLSSTNEDYLFKFRGEFVAIISQDISVTLHLSSFGFPSLESDLVCWESVMMSWEPSGAEHRYFLRSHWKMPLEPLSVCLAFLQSQPMWHATNTINIKGHDLGIWSPRIW